MRRSLRILLADNEERIRYGLRALLRQQPGWIVIGEAQDEKDLMSLASVLKPDLVLLDWKLRDLSSVEVIHSMRVDLQNLPVIVLSGDRNDRSSALSAGANAFFCKANPPEELINIIQSIFKTQ